MTLDRIAVGGILAAASLLLIAQAASSRGLASELASVRASMAEVATSLDEVDDRLQAAEETLRAVEDRVAASRADRETSGPPQRRGRHLWNGILPAGEDRFRVDIDELRWALRNPDRVLRTFRVEPHLEDGRETGLRVSSIRRRGVLRKLGIRNGDVITHIDGRPVAGQQDSIAELLEELESRPEVAVELLRLGEPVVLHYEVQQFPGQMSTPTSASQGE